MMAGMRSGVACMLLLGASAALAADAQVAIAANFAAPAKQLAEHFARTTPHRLTISLGSTGKFYAQISNGAPFDAFLSADDEAPLRLERQQLAVAGSRYTYAIGILALWSPVAQLVDGKGEVLRSGSFRHLAIANPRVAPYGAAARQALEKLGLWQALQGRLVLGENIAQTFQFVSSGNAELGFIAYAQIHAGGKAPAGSHWRVPRELHEPIRQDAVLLARGAANPAARAFLEFLRGPQARELIRASGYELP